MCKTTTRDCEAVDTEIQKPAVATVEDALSLTGFGKYNIGLLLVCSWTLQAMGLDMFGLSFVVAAAVCDLELTLQQRALLTAMPLLGVVVGAQFWGYISDTKGRRLTLILSMSIGFAFSALSSFSPNWQSMAVLKFISSIFTSASNSGAYTLVGESTTAPMRSKLMLLCTCALLCSQACAAVYAYPILPLKFNYWIEFLGISFRPWRLLTLVMSLSCAVAACLLGLFHESPIFLASQGKYEEALYVLKSIYKTNSGKDADTFPVKKLLESHDKILTEGRSFFGCVWAQTLPLFQSPLLKHTLMLFYVVVVIFTTGSGFILWLPYVMNSLFSVLEVGGGDGLNLCGVIDYNVEDVTATPFNITEVSEVCDDTIQNTTLISVMVYGALCSSCNVFLSLTCGNRKRAALIGILVMSAASGVLLNLITVPIAGGILFFFFVMVALAMGITSVYFVELYPASLRGMMSCLSVMVGRLSAFVGVNAIGTFISTNCEATFYGWSLLLLSALAVAWFLPKDKRPTK